MLPLVAVKIPFDVSVDFPLRTGRLIMRTPIVDDRESWIKLHADPRVMRYIGAGAIWPAEESSRMLDVVIDYFAIDYPRRRMIDWLTMLNADSGEFIGICCLVPMNRKFRDCLGTDKQYWEFGWRFLPQHWSKGYATEASRALMQWGFERLAVDELAGLADERNAASNAVFRKLGFHLERRFQHDNIQMNLHLISRGSIGG
jgi:RimJ/RimL family protein N-acetyltransferase